MLAYLKQKLSHQHYYCGPELQIVAQVVGAVSSVAGFMGSQEARGEQRQAAEDQAAAQRRMAEERRVQAENEKKRADIQNVRSVRQQIRQQRIAAASIAGRAATGGTIGSSGMAGGIASTQAQLAGNLSYSSDIADVNTAQVASGMRYGAAEVSAGQAQADYTRASADLAGSQALQNFGQTIFTQAGGWQTIFGGNQGPSANAAGSPAYKPARAPSYEMGEG